MVHFLFITPLNSISKKTNVSDKIIVGFLKIRKIYSVGMNINSFLGIYIKQGNKCQGKIYNFYRVTTIASFNNNCL